MTLSPRLAVIGSGAIVPFHLDAALGVGMRLAAIGSREGSKTAPELASRYGIATVGNDWRDILDMELDAVLIAVPPEATPEVLRAAMDCGVPTLVEKPAAMDSETLRQLAQHSGSSKVMVGYNRRHYSSTRALREFIVRQDSPVTYSARIPELSTLAEPSQPRVAYTVLANSVHVLDLLNYLFGPQELHAEGLHNFAGTPSWLGGLARSSSQSDAHASSSAGSVVLTFGSPGTYRLEVMARGAAAELSPLEFFRAFDGMVVQPPTAEVPIRRYRMRQAQSFELDSVDVEFKPGFYRQYQEFRDLVEGRADSSVWNSASLTDALRATELAEALLRCAARE